MSEDKLNEDKKIKYAFWIALITLASAIVTQWDKINPWKSDDNAKTISQPGITITNTNTIKSDNAKKIKMT